MRCEFDVDDDPLRLPRERDRRQAEALAEIDHRDDLAAVVGDAFHGLGRAREIDDLERIHDLAHDLDPHRVHDVADEEADQIFRRIMTMTRHSRPPFGEP